MTDASGLKIVSGTGHSIVPETGQRVQGQSAEMVAAFAEKIEQARELAATSPRTASDSVYDVTAPPPEENTVYVEVVEGQSLWQIAEDAGVEPWELIAYNPQFSNPDLIRPGDIVFVNHRDTADIATPKVTPGGHQSELM